MIKRTQTALAILYTIVMFCTNYACSNSDDEVGIVEIVSIHIGLQRVDLNSALITGISAEEQIVIQFTKALDENLVNAAISLDPGNPQNLEVSLSDGGKTIRISPEDLWLNNTTYSLSITSALKALDGSSFEGITFDFQTKKGALTLKSILIDQDEVLQFGHLRILDVNHSPTIRCLFSNRLDESALLGKLLLNGNPIMSYDLEDDGLVVNIHLSELNDFDKFTLTLSDEITGIHEESFEGYELVFFTGESELDKFDQLSTDALLTKVQQQTFRYFWDFAHPISGLARERNTSGDLVTIGGSGFGLLSILVGIERNFISQSEGIERIQTIVDFLSKADRFHGAWPHWMNGTTGEVIPFSANDNGADLVETAFMMQGLLSVRAYLNQYRPEEAQLVESITNLWHEVEWDWFTQDGEDQLYWHWSPDFNWQIDLPIRGYNEALMVYVLAAASPTYPIDKSVYDKGWTRDGQFVNGQNFYNINLPLGPDLGGPLFFEHYSFQSLNPRVLADNYGNYWDQVVNHSLINQAYCNQNSKRYVGYSDRCWGLTASDSHNGYSAHSPSNDLGVISPTAALSSMPYVPEASIQALEFFYYKLGDRLWGDFGFYDAFNLTEQWTATSFLAIDQGPIINMIENYRTGLLWQLFMSDIDIQNGLKKLDFTF